MKSAIADNQEDWRIWLGTGSKFLMRWGWFVLACMALVTLLSILQPDAPSYASSIATLQVQIQLPGGLNGKVQIAATTSFFQSLFVSPDTLNLALPKLAAMKQFQGMQLADLQGFISASAVTNTNQILLSAYTDTPDNARVLVTTVYQALDERMHTAQAPVLSGLQTSLNNELVQVRTNQTDTTNEIQTLKAEGRSYTYQARLLGSLQAEELHLINDLNDLLVRLNQRSDKNSDMLVLGNPTPDITTYPAADSMQGLRIALSPLTGLIMGIGGALLASRFSTRLPLRGKKRELVLPHIATVIPALTGLQTDPLTMLTLKAGLLLPLLRRLHYQSREHETSLRFITVTSSRGQEGKSTIATSLAIASAQSGQRTLLVDAHPQRPILDRWFQPSSTIGLMDTLQALTHGTTSPSPLQPTAIANLTLLAIGNSARTSLPDQLAEPLRLNGLVPLMPLLAREADIIIFDGPSLLTGSECINLVAISDVVLLVVNAQTSKSATVIEAEALLKTMDSTFVTVLNRARRELVE